MVLNRGELLLLSYIIPSGVPTLSTESINLVFWVWHWQPRRLVAEGDKQGSSCSPLPQWRCRPFHQQMGHQLIFDVHDLWNETLKQSIKRSPTPTIMKTRAYQTVCRTPFVQGWHARAPGTYVPGQAPTWRVEPR